MVGSMGSWGGHVPRKETGREESGEWVGRGGGRGNPRGNQNRVCTYSLLKETVSLWKAGRKYLVKCWLLFLEITFISYVGLLFLSFFIIFFLFSPL